MCICVPRSLILGEMIMILMMVPDHDDELFASIIYLPYLPYLTCTSRVAEWQNAEVGGRVR